MVDKRSGGNVTVEPLAQATPVDDPEIVEIISCDDGLVLKARDFIASHLYQDLIAARVRIRERLNSDKPQFLCAWCGTPAYIVSTPEKLFFFRHIVEDGSCPAETRSGLTEHEIRARKYHGLRESDAHLRIKALVERSLSADPNFHTIFQEKVWRSARNPKARRQPDVQASSVHRRFAFEVQLSTTFLDVVVGRRMFYRDEGALLIWVFGHFTPNYRRLTTDDLLFSNNSNLFVVDDETTLLSETASAFHLRCFYRRPVRHGAQIIDNWEEKIVRFDGLTCEHDSQRAFYFDYEGAEQALWKEIDQERVERRRQADEELRKADEELRKAFFALWRDAGPDFDHRPESFARWNELRSRLKARGLAMPDAPDEDRGIRALLNALLSAEAGQPVGWGFKKLIEVAHHLAQNYPQHLLAFGYAVEHFGHKATLESQDASGKWQRLSLDLRAKLQKRNPDYMPASAHLPILHFFFPPVAERVSNFINGLATLSKPQHEEA